MGRAGGPKVIDMPTCANDAVEIARATTVNNSERMAGMIRMAFPPAFDLSFARFCSAAADCADCMARFSDSTAESPTRRGDIVPHRNNEPRRLQPDENNGIGPDYKAWLP